MKKTICLSSTTLAVVLGIVSAGIASAPAAVAAEVKGPKIKWDVSL